MTTETIDNREKALNAVLDKLNKTHGKGAVMRMSDKPLVDIEVIPTGSLGLDIALGVGGFPKGRIIEIYGPESSGKTTLAIHAMVECQRQGGNVAIIDAEHAFDTKYATQLGMNTEKIIISQPDCGEQALEIAESLISSGAIDMITIDSVAALTPRSEIEGEMGASQMGLAARLMSQAMRKLTGVIHKTNTCAIFINQLRSKIGGYGNPETTTGGNALKFYASIRLDIRKSGTQIKDKDGNIIANPTKVKVIKNKVAPPFKIAEFEIQFGKGINRMKEIIDLSAEYNIIEKSGSWYAYEGTKIGQGSANSEQFLKDNPEVATEIEGKLMAIYSASTTNQD